MSSSTWHPGYTTMTVQPDNRKLILRAADDLAAGKAVVLVDDTNESAEGTLVFAAEMATSDLMAFAVRRTFGYIRVALHGADCDRLGLPLMYSDDRDDRSVTAHTVTVDAAIGTTGISATDRATTARMLADVHTGPGDFTRPGHVVPTRVDENGVLSQLRPSEAAVDLSRIARLRPAAVLCEIVSEEVDGEVAHHHELAVFAAKYDLTLVTISELVAYRQQCEQQVTRVAELRIPVRLDGFHAVVYGSRVDDIERIAFVHGALGTGHDVLVHEHVEHRLESVAGAAPCPCSQRLDSAMAIIAEAGSGVVIYHRPSTSHSQTPLKQPLSDDPCESGRSARNPVVSAQILADLGVHSVRLLVDEVARG